MTKVYEFLTIGDIRARAGEIGSRRGGFLGYRKWSVRVRAAIFAGCLMGFWASVARLFFYGRSSKEGQETVNLITGILVGVALLSFVFLRLFAMVKRNRGKSLARRRAKRMDGILKTEGAADE